MARKQVFSTLKLVEMLQTESDAYLLLEQLRWGADGPDACPKCGEVGKCVYIAPKNGSDRLTRTGSASQRRVWRCKGCRKQFSVLTDTIMHGTKIPVRTWLLVIFDVCTAKNSISAWEVSRKYDMTNESAWHMLHRIRRAMEKEPLAGLFTGTVQPMRRGSVVRRRTVTATTRRSSAATSQASGRAPPTSSRSSPSSTTRPARSAPSSSRT